MRFSTSERDFGGDAPVGRRPIGLACSVDVAEAVQARHQELVPRIGIGGIELERKLQLLLGLLVASHVGKAVTLFAVQLTVSWRNEQCLVQVV